MADAQRSEQIPWPALVDDVEGTVHRAYGGLANPTYLIGTEGGFFLVTRRSLNRLTGGARARGRRRARR